MALDSRTAARQRPALWFSALSGDSDGSFRDRALRSGQGCFVRDISGRRYLDARSALWNAALGYGNRRIMEAMSRQLAELPVAQIIRHDQPTEAALGYAERLMAVLPSHLARVRFCTTGAEAVEGAVFLSRFIRFLEKQPDRTEVVALWDGYHGTGGLASALTGERSLHETQGPLVPGVHHVPAGDPGALRDAIRRIGVGRITAVVMEPVLGTDVVELTAEYLHEVQRICRADDIHFILDEVSTGFGRTGSMTVAGRLGVAPDMILLSKGITSGYVPLSAIAVTDDVQARSLAVPGVVFPHGSTGDGHPLAVAAGTAVLDEMDNGDVLANVAARGEQLTSAFRELDLPAIGGVHGPGLMIAVELADSDGTPLSPQQMTSVKDCCRAAGLLVSISNHMVVLTPPLVITPTECDLLVARLVQGIEQAVGRQAVLAVG